MDTLNLCQFVMTKSMEKVNNFKQFNVHNENHDREVFLNVEMEKVSGKEDAEVSLISESDCQSFEENNTNLSPKELPHTPNHEYAVQTPSRETYFVMTPSYYLRSSIKRKKKMLDDDFTKKLSFNDSQIKNGSADKSFEITPSKGHAPRKCNNKHKCARSRSLLVKSTSNINGGNQETVPLVALCSVPRKKQKKETKNCDKLKLKTAPSKAVVANSIKDSSVTATVNESFLTIQSVIKTCQTVRRSKRNDDTSCKIHLKASKKDEKNNDKYSVKSLGKRKVSSANKVCKNENNAELVSDVDKPVLKKSKLEIANASVSNPVRRSVRFSTKSSGKSPVDAENCRSSRSCRTVCKRKSANCANPDDSEQPESEKLLSFKAQPVPRSLYNQPKLMKNSLNLTIPKSPMFSSKYAVRRKSQIAEKETAELHKFFNPKPKFSTVFKPKLNSVNTKPQPFSFDAKDKERLQRRSQKLQEISKPKVLAIKFKAQPVPVNVLQGTSLPSKQVKKPTKVEPFQLRSNERAAARATEAPLTTEERECQKLATFKANRDYKKITEGKPWKPKIEHKPSTQTRGFIFRSEKRAKKRETSKKNKSVLDAKNRENENQIQTKHETNLDKINRLRPFTHRENYNAKSHRALIRRGTSKSSVK